MTSTLSNETHLSWVAEEILAQAPIDLTPLEIICFATREHIESVAISGSSCWIDHGDQPIGHAHLISVINEIATFFTTSEDF